MGSAKSSTFPTAPSLEEGQSQPSAELAPIEGTRRKKKQPATWGGSDADDSGSTTPSSSRRPSPHSTFIVPASSSEETSTSAGGSGVIQHQPRPGGSQITIEKIENGISLRCIQNEFFVQCGGRDALKAFSVEEVLERFILPKTQDDRQSYCEKLLHNDPNVKQKAQVYLIYPTQTKFLDVVDMLEEHYQGQDVILWWDIFCLHKAALRKQTFSRLDKHLLCRLLQRLDKVNIILARDAVSGLLQSGRAMVQCFYAIQEKEPTSQVEFLMSKDTKFQLHSNPEQAANVFVSHDDSEDAMCKLLVDKLDPAILSFVQDHMGMLPFHQKVFSLLRQWLMSYMEGLYQNTYDLKRRMGLEKALLDLYRIEGIAKSIIFSNVFHNIVFRAQSTESDTFTADTLDLLNRVASLSAQHGNFEDAEACYQLCLQKRKAFFGRRHPDVITTENNLVTLAHLKGNIDHMTSLVSVYFTMRKREFGELHPVTIDTLQRLVEAYELGGRHREVESLLLQHWQTHAMHLGDDHIKTLDALHRIAVYYCQHAEWVKAGPLLSACLDRRRQSLGESHPATLSTAYWTAYCWHWQGSTEKALQDYTDCLYLQETVMGRHHSETLQTLHQYASLLQCIHVSGETTLETFQEYHKRNREKYGDKHPETIFALQQLAHCGEKQGDFEQAELLYMLVYKACVEVFGKQDPHTWQAMKQLAIIYEKQEVFVEAESFAKLYKTQAKMVQKTRPEVLFDSVHVLISVYWSAGKVKEVEQLIQDLLFYSLEHFGNGHQNVRDVESLSQALDLWKIDLAGQRRPLMRKKMKKEPQQKLICVVSSTSSVFNTTPDSSWSTRYRGIMLDTRLPTADSVSLLDKPAPVKLSIKPPTNRFYTAHKTSIEPYSPTTKARQQLAIQALYSGSKIK